METLCVKSNIIKFLYLCNRNNPNQRILQSVNLVNFFYIVQRIDIQYDFH